MTKDEIDKLVQGYCDKLSRENGAEYASIVVRAAKIKASVADLIKQGGKDKEEIESEIVKGTMLLTLMLLTAFPEKNEAETKEIQEGIIEDSDKLIDYIVDWSEKQSEIEQQPK